MRNKFYIYLLCFVPFMINCSKDKDVIKPTIVVSAPVHMQQVYALDTIEVTAKISDDRNIERVSVSLKDDNGNQVLTSVTRKPNTQEYLLSIYYDFDDIHMQAGVYNFDISAYDGENTAHEYVEVTVNDVNKIRQGVFVVSNTSNLSEFYLLDNFFNASFYQSISGDYLGSAVNSYDQQLLHTSSVTGSITSIDLKSGSVEWNIPIINSPPTPYYMGFLYDNRRIFMGLRNSVIQGYDKNAIPNYGAAANSNHYVYRSLVHEEYYYVTAQEAISGGQQDLVLYWYASGVMAQQIAINEDIKGVYSQNSSTLVVLTNDAGLNGKLIFYNIPSGLTSSPFAINTNQIDDCVEISAGVYLVANGGDITLVNANSFSTLPYLTGVNTSRLWYDNVSNELFVGNGNSLDVYDYPSKSLKGNYTHSNSIKEVLFWYNK